MQADTPKRSVGRPRKAETVVKFSVRYTPTVLNKVTALAKQKGIPCSVLIGQAALKTLQPELDNLELEVG